MKIVIPGKFESMNEYIRRSKIKRRNWNAGNAMKQEDQKTIMLHLPHGVRFKKKIFIEYNFFEPNAKRDKDNISSYFHKIFQDALVQAGIIENDGWKNIEGWSDFFKVDQKNPRIEVFIEELK